MGQSKCMKKIFQRVFVVLAIAALAGYATWSFFHDEETSTGNTFKAGELDLTVDSECHYDGMVCGENNVWVEETSGSSTFPELIDQPCSCRWIEPKNLVEGTDLFFNFDDVKPGDFGENTISLHVKDNPSWVCASVRNLANADNACNEPEGLEDTTCGDPGIGEGELQDNLNVTIWRDIDCDNQWDEEDNEEVLVENQPINGNNGVWPLFAPGIADSTPLPGDTKTCIGLAWGISNEVGNIIQTDSVTGDISFYAEQARHNENFVCPGLEPGPQRPEVGAALDEYVQPEGESCNITVDDDDDANFATIQAAIDDAGTENGETVCVADGTYNENVLINKSITLAGDGATATSTINGTVKIEAPDVTLEGFAINGPASVQKTPGIGFDNVRIAYNSITTTDANGILYGGAAPNVTPGIVEHNIVTAPGKLGVYIDQNGVTGFIVRYNTVDARKAVGFGSAAGGSIENNDLTSSGAGTLAVTESYDDKVTVHTNNFSLDGIVRNAGASATLDAENNWWGDNDPSDQIVGNVDFDPFEAVPFPLN